MLPAIPSQTIPTQALALSGLPSNPIYKIAMGDSNVLEYFRGQHSAIEALPAKIKTGAELVKQCEQQGQIPTLWQYGKPLMITTLASSSLGALAGGGLACNMMATFAENGTLFNAPTSFTAGGLTGFTVGCLTACAATIISKENTNSEKTHHFMLGTATGALAGAMAPLLYLSMGLESISLSLTLISLSTMLFGSAVGIVLPLALKQRKQRPLQAGLQELRSHIQDKQQLARYFQERPDELRHLLSKKLPEHLHAEAAKVKTEQDSLRAEDAELKNKLARVKMLKAQLTQPGGKAVEVTVLETETELELIQARKYIKETLATLEDQALKPIAACLEKLPTFVTQLDKFKQTQSAVAELQKIHRAALKAQGKAAAGIELADETEEWLRTLMVNVLEMVDEVHVLSEADQEVKALALKNAP